MSDPRRITPAPALMAGAVDLAALRRPSDNQQQAGLANVLRQLGFVCGCGQRITRGGVEITAVQVGPVGNPPQQGIKVDRLTFCSMQCQAFQQASVQLNDEEQAVVIVVRPLLESLWMKAPD